jgi:hypothetical protein
VVQTNDGFANFGPPIVSANPNDYYRAPIDEMFYRIPHINMRHSFERLLIPELVRFGQPLAGAAVANLWNSVAWAIINNGAGPIGNGGPGHAPGNQYYPLLNALVLNDWFNFGTGVHQGWMPNARSAALFYRTFISDHLPLLIDFDV